MVAMSNVVRVVFVHETALLLLHAALLIIHAK